MERLSALWDRKLENTLLHCLGDIHPSRVSIHMNIESIKSIDFMQKLVRLALYFFSFLWRAYLKPIHSFIRSFQK